MWNYYKDKPKDGAVGNGNEKIATSSSDSKSFSHKTKITWEFNTGDNRKNGIKIVVPLKNLSNLCRTLTIPLINCEVLFTWNGFENYVITQLVW